MNNNYKTKILMVLQTQQQLIRNFYNILLTQLIFMLEGKMDQLSNYIVRPRRRQYNISELGPKVFKSEYCLCTRQDFEVLFEYGCTYGYPKPQENQKQPKTTKKVKLQCSIFTPHFSYKNEKTDKRKMKEKSPNDFISFQRTCVLSMHGNTGTRISTLSNLQSVLKFGLAFACFDFAGCGLSEGEFVTLGYYEKYQISAVLEHINKNYGYHKFILYGRSMGAASSLFYSCLIYPNYTQHKLNKIKQYCLIQSQLLKKQKKDHLQLQYDIITKLDVGHFGYEIVGIILDSPYYDIQGMVMDLVKSKIWFVPRFLVNYAIRKVSERVKVKLSNANISPINEETIDISQQLIIVNQNKQQKQKVTGSQFCLLKSTKIPEKAQIPFPVFVMYGLKDDVILREHTLQLFKRIVSQNKKLHVFGDQGHGDHRDDKIKKQAIEWILDFQCQRVNKRMDRDAKLFGMDIEDYTNWILNNSKTSKVQYKELKFNQILVQKQKTKQLISQITTQRTASISSYKFRQAHVSRGFGSLTSVQQKHPPIYQSADKKQQKIVRRQRKTRQKITISEKYQPKIQSHDEIQQQISQEVLLCMSRIAPYKILRRKIGIQKISKPIKTIVQHTPIKKQMKQIQLTNYSSECLK